jgi:hypothetical protein
MRAPCSRRGIHSNSVRKVALHAIRFAKLIVGAQCRALALEQTGAVHLDQSNGATTQLEVDLGALIRCHSDPEEDYHLGLHQVPSGMHRQSVGRGRHCHCPDHSSPHIQRLTRNLKWVGTADSADGSYDFCVSKLGVIAFGVNSLS